jgi:hypothetical protein
VIEPGGRARPADVGQRLLHHRKTVARIPCGLTTFSSVCTAAAESCWRVWQHPSAFEPNW